MMKKNKNTEKGDRTPCDVNIYKESYKHLNTPLDCHSGALKFDVFRLDLAYQRRLQAILKSNSYTRGKYYGKHFAFGN